ncbi:MAG: hypothetical protein IKM61_05165 [Eubacteriaceae bacterium]|nr:hypothetical protein [Eubacteriaceae bacterium]
MKKVLCLIIATLMLLCDCSHSHPDQSHTDTLSEKYTFTKDENGDIVSNSGVEYTFLANEGILYYLGNLEFIGSVQGEEKTYKHLGDSHQTGMFKLKNATNDNILIRYVPNNEWFAIYRKTSLPAYDFSVNNCIRLEFVSGIGNAREDVTHTTCGDGLSDQSEICKFLSEIRMQNDPRESGLYDLIRKPDGALENCYIYGVVYGFFKEYPDLTVRMSITSYNDLAYSISIDGEEYVLPEEWLLKLKNK